uniref:NADH-ubiquinone oxidoreductase chain 2 n=1 Tax=Acanthocoris sp. FS-2019 TaxID=2575684 RepID=A0A4D6X1J9_9HEMI|nr:NADH dehydrogenase subunit 2 [Acanthocoris sp. FS-2019]
MNSSKLLFFMMLIISTMITMSANNWFGMWIGLEINLMSFIPLIFKTNDKSASQAMMIYFLTQTIGSMVLLFSLLINPIIFTSNLTINESINILIMSSTMIKMGAAPFHFWLPEVMANIKWMECMILMTWQKLGPLIVMSNITPTNWALYTSVILSTAVGSIKGLNQSSIRKIMAYSSINHLGWMMMFMTMQTSWYKYLLIYSIMVIMICLLMNKMNVFFINQLMSNSPSMMEKYTYVITMLSMGGLPPFLGFLPKWMVIQSMINSKLFMIMLIMMLLSLLTLFYYTRMVSSFILSYSTINKWTNYHKPNNMMLFSFITINFTLPVFMSTGFF